MVALGLAPLPALAGSNRIAVGAPAPDFTLTTIDGATITRDDLRGQVVILNYWATWCVPCRKELPTLDAYSAALRDSGLRAFAVTTEDSLPLAQLKKLFAAMRMTPVRRLKGAYAPIKGVPTNIVIGRDGRIRYAQAGALTLDALNALIIPLLNEPAPAPLPAASPVAAR